MVYSVLFQQDANNGMSVKEAGMFLHSPETNIAPENRPSQKETSIPTIHFQVRTVSFREGIFLFLGNIDSHVPLGFGGPTHSGRGVFGSMAKMLNKVDRSVGFEAWNWAKWFMVLLKDGRTSCGCQSLVDDDDDEENYIWCFILLPLLVICILAILVVLAILVIIVVLIVILIVAILMIRVFVVIIVIRVITIIIVTIDIVAVIIFFHMIFFLTIILMFHFHFYHVFFSVFFCSRGPEAYGANYSKTMKHALDEAVFASRNVSREEPEDPERCRR